eukprot:785561_1
MCKLFLVGHANPPQNRKSTLFISRSVDALQNIITMETFKTLFHVAMVDTDADIETFKTILQAMTTGLNLNQIEMMQSEDGRIRVECKSLDMLECIKEAMHNKYVFGTLVQVQIVSTKTDTRRQNMKHMDEQSNKHEHKEKTEDMAGKDRNGDRERDRERHRKRDRERGGYTKHRNRDRTRGRERDRERENEIEAGKDIEAEPEPKEIEKGMMIRDTINMDIIRITVIEIDIKSTYSE